MNSKVLIFLFISLLFSCNTGIVSEELIGEKGPRTKRVKSFIESDGLRLNKRAFFDVSIEEAICLANKMCDSNKLIEVFPIKFEDITLCYVANYSKGWVLISADKRTSPILASDESGQINKEGRSPKGLDMWIDDICGQLLKLKEMECEDIEGNSLFWDHVNIENKRGGINEISRSDSLFEYGGWLKIPQASYFSTTYLHNIPHLIMTKWGQTSPWWEMCYTFMDSFGNTNFFPTGCTAVAVSQILYYYHNFCGVPSGFYHTFDLCLHSSDGEHYYSDAYRANWHNQSYYWAGMPLDSLGNNTSYVAMLMADVGDRLNMEYTINSGSSAPMNPSTLSLYGLDCTAHSYNDNDPYIGSNILNELDNSRPVIIVAYATQYTTGIWPFQTMHYDDGHTWIIDGYHIKQFNYTDYYEWRRVTAEEMQTVYSHLGQGVTFYTEEEANAIQPGLYNGLIVSEQYSTNGGVYWKMNWGYDGQFDSGEFSAGLYPWWTISDGESPLYYRYYRTVYYVSESINP